MAPGARAALARAGRDVLADPGRSPVALAGFLARGGIVPLALPILVLPSIVGLITFAGADAVTAAGPSASLIRLIGVALVGGLFAVIVGTVVGAAMEVAGAEACGSLASVPGRSTLVRRVALVRAAGLVPLGLALGLAVPVLGATVYRELILPGDLGVPFAIRVVLGAPGPMALILVGWQLGELVGAPATRLVAFDGAGVPAALGGTIRLTLRRPVAVLAMWLATFAVSVATLAVAVAAIALAWRAVWAEFLVDRAGAGGNAGPEVVAALGSLGGLVVAWSFGLALVGLAAAWRTAAWSHLALLVRDGDPGSA